MKKTYERQDAERLLPLLSSIGGEVRSRLAALSRIEGLIAALTPTRRVHRDDLQVLESDLSTQRRELRRAEGELARLGCRLETEETVRVLIPAGRSDHRVEGFLGQTRFRPASSVR